MPSTSASHPWSSRGRRRTSASASLPSALRLPNSDRHLPPPHPSRQIARDEDYTLFGVTVFKKTKDEFLQKSREAKFIARDFTYDEGAVEKGRKDLDNAQREERQLYVRPLLCPSSPSRWRRC